MQAGWRTLSLVFCFGTSNNKISSMPEGKILRLRLLMPALVHWSIDGWATSHDTNTRATEPGDYIVDLPTKDMTAGDESALPLTGSQRTSGGCGLQNNRSSAESTRSGRPCDGPRFRSFGLA